MPEPGTWIPLQGFNPEILHLVKLFPASPQFGLEDLLTVCGIWTGRKGHEGMKASEGMRRCRRCDFQPPAEDGAADADL